MTHHYNLSTLTPKQLAKLHAERACCPVNPIIIAPKKRD